MWCTGTSGLPVAQASPFAKDRPVSSAPISPGSTVTAMASTSAIDRLAFSNALRVTPQMASVCAREAISGTTPPYSLCISICEATTLESSVRPSSTTAAAVSSQELSKPKIRIF